MFTNQLRAAAECIQTEALQDELDGQHSRV